METEEIIETTAPEIITEKDSDNPPLIIVTVDEPDLPDQSETASLLKSIAANLVEMRLEIIEAQVRQNNEVINIVKTVYDKLNELTERQAAFSESDEGEKETVIEEVAQPVKSLANKRWL